MRTSSCYCSSSNRGLILVFVIFYSNTARERRDSTQLLIFKLRYAMGTHLALQDEKLIGVFIDLWTMSTEPWAAIQKADGRMMK